MKDEILRLRAEEKTYNEIKAILGCSKSTISFHCGAGQKEKNRKRLNVMRSRKKTKVSLEKDMDDKTWIGSLAEIKVISALTMDKFHVFNQISGKAPYDLIAVKNNKLVKISVKGTLGKALGDGYYEIQIGRVRSNKKENKVYKFNNQECDVLAIYIYEEDVVCFVAADKIKSGRSINLRKEMTKNRYGSKLLISALSKIEL